LKNFQLITIKCRNQKGKANDRCCHKTTFKGVCTGRFFSEKHWLCAQLICLTETNIVPRRKDPECSTR
jgi:hypothetical protein